MSVDVSLRVKASLARHRNVLKRAERVARLKELDKWDDAMDVIGLPKVANRKLASKKKVKTPEEAAAAAPGAAPAAGAPAAATAAPEAKPVESKGAGKPGKK